MKSRERKYLRQRELQRIVQRLLDENREALAYERQRLFHNIMWPGIPYNPDAKFTIKPCKVTNDDLGCTITLSSDMFRPKTVFINASNN